MKKLLLLLFVSSLFTVNAQEFEVRKLIIEEGSNASKGTFEYMKPMMVLEVEGTPTELYNKAINWVNETYKNPEEVIKGKVEGDYLRLDGFKSNLTQQSALGMTYYYDVRYTVKLNFKDDRFKYEITKMEYTNLHHNILLVVGLALWLIMRLDIKPLTEKEKLKKMVLLTSML